MPELLLELFSEEIPARMQPRAAADLKRLVIDGLKEAGLTFNEARAFATPRRLTLVIDGIPKKSPDVKEERKGPRVGASEKAVQGFLKAAGLESIDQAEVVSDSKKGDFYVAKIEKPGRAATNAIESVVRSVVWKFPWPKSQRWGALGGFGEGGFGQGRFGKVELRWVRPLRSILCLFGGKVVRFKLAGINTASETRGHRFMAPEPFKVKSFADYKEKLRVAKVILDGQERAEIILKEARKLAGAKKLKLVEDEGLLAENAGLVEWPVVLMGEFDKPFLEVPPEVLTSSMKAHQKCFSVTGKGARLANRFLMVANLVAGDGGKAIAEGNKRVIRARLADAKFFWDQDRKRKLDDLLPELDGVIFHEKLGTQRERVERIKKLARELAPIVGADPDMAERAAELCKADLVTDMVGEFPDLQGLMGRYYALEQGEPAEVAQAIEEHYKPQGPNDAVPTEPVSIAVALADKLDTLVGFWAIDEKPTGSKDPYALRRAALGVVRIVLENKIRLPLVRALSASGLLHRRRSLENHFDRQARDRFRAPYKQDRHGNHSLCWPADSVGAKPPSGQEIVEFVEEYFSLQEVVYAADFEAWELNDRPIYETPDHPDFIYRVFDWQEFSDDLFVFFTDRLKVHLRDRGARHDLIDAVIGQGVGDAVSTSPLRGEVGARSAPGGGGATGAEPDAVPPSLALPHKGGGDKDDLALPHKGGGDTHEGGGNAQEEGGDDRHVGPAAVQDDLLMIVRRVEALGNFLGSDDGANLLIGVKRAANILRIEEKKDKTSYDGTADVALLKEKEEKALHKAIGEVTRAAGKCIEKEDFEGAMAALARLRVPVDAFFDHVTVNADDKDLRSNRLALLSEIRRATLKVADFSKIEG